MTASFQPRVAEEIWQMQPDYRALSVTVSGFSVHAEPCVDLTVVAPPYWMDAHLEAWRNAYRRFGSNPKRTPSSFDTLWKRLQKDGSLPKISPLVDLYNALSLRFGAPFGGEDADHYVGSPRLKLATGSESFDTMRNGEVVLEPPERGEIIWLDDRGITCRRWNWRQCKRTALTSTSHNLWFVIDRLLPMPLEELVHAGEALSEGLRRISPEAEISTSLLEPGNKTFGNRYR